ncbi:DHHA1 domain-containing protein [Acidithiobacillus caldus]|uniref:DHHA1 domain-containing protein n=1 Tax=Acidithiobacillus caldus TaxID=33059 RepID=UPI00068A4D72|nr:DHHA1 domain-containing protein [Acidithiobacillus caldus]
MRTGVRLLLSQDEQAAREIARTLDQLNRERRSIEDGIREEAEEIAAQIVSAPQDGEPFVLCPYQPDWHEGVIGIVAARLRERFHRPTIVFTKTADGSIKGSGRSIPWFHIRDAIAAVDAQHPSLITKFGGHAAAAGLSLAKETDIAVFTEAFAAVARRELRASDLEEIIYSDGELGEARRVWTRRWRLRKAAHGEGSLSRQFFTALSW